mgnify:CR=1 FL=1
MLRLTRQGRWGTYDEATPDAKTAETKAQVEVLCSDEESGKLLKMQIEFADAAVAEPEKGTASSPPLEAVARDEWGHGILGCRPSFRSRGLKQHA